MKKGMRLVLGISLSIVMSFTSFAAGQWQQDNSGWWYQNEDGSYPASILKQINGTWYYFDNTGYMKTGWIQFSDGWYEFREDGSSTNPTSETTGYLVGSPAQGWIHYNSTPSSLADGINAGNVIYYNNLYWASPDYISNLEQLAERDMITAPTRGNTAVNAEDVDWNEYLKNRYGIQ